MTTICSCCGKVLDESVAEGTFILCKPCGRFTPKGAHSYKKYKEVKNMEEKKDLSKYVQCVKCKKYMFTNAVIMKKRIEKFGSEENMRAGYICRKCKKDVQEKKE